jgi:RHS repeat-associated protein
MTTYSYDAASQLLSIAHQLGATTIDSFTYTYDKVGNRNSKADNNGTANYTYDALNRLIQAINPLPSNPLESFTYDAVGNRTNSNQNGASTFNQANQLLEDANFTYQYDNNGNMIRKTAKIGAAVTTYEYDAENKLARVMTATKTVNYKYDGLGRRVEKEVIDAGTTTTRYVYDNEDILLELNGANSITARYTHGPGIDEPLIMEKNGQAFHYHADGLGSITEITNQTGTVVQRYAYSSFGKIELQLDPNFVQPYTFTSREFDVESGLYYFRLRYYDPISGRFVTEDPKRFGAGVNFYGYVDGNPIGNIDPYGLDALTHVANFSAGAGDFLSGGFMNMGNMTQRVLGHRAIPISELLRQELVASIGLSDMVDQCSTAYAVGKYTGLALGAGIIWSAGLNGGANSVFWSGPGAKAAAVLRGTTLEQTPIGAVLDAAKELSIPIHDWVWKLASATFAGNASGQVQAVTRQAGRVWSTVELQILRWRGITIIGTGQ